MAAKYSTVTIYGERWKFRSLTAEEFQKKHPDVQDALAVTDTNTRTMDFIGIPTLGRVFHELTHAYVSYLHMDGSNLKPEHAEEMICHLLEQRIEKMNEQTTKMLAKLSGVKP